MSDILKFIVDNFNQLQPFDYFLILLFVGLSSLGISIASRKIYGAVIEAQSNLIQIKDETIAAHKESSDRLKTEKDELQVSLSEMEIHLRGTYDRFRELQSKHVELKDFLQGVMAGMTTLWKTALISGLAIGRIERVGIHRRMVYVYAELRPLIKGESPEPMGLLQQLDRLEADLVSDMKDVDTILFSQPRELPVDVPPKLLELAKDENFDVKLNTLKEEIDRLVDPIIVKLKSAGRRDGNG
jgi:hypothetical protein